MYSTVMTQLYTLQSGPHPDVSSTHLTPHSYYSIIDYIPCAVLDVSVIILLLPICTP